MFLQVYTGEVFQNNMEKNSDNESDTGVGEESGRDICDPSKDINRVMESYLCRKTIWKREQIEEEV